MICGAHRKTSSVSRSVGLLPAQSYSTRCIVLQCATLFAPRASAGGSSEGPSQSSRSGKLRRRSLPPTLTLGAVAAFFFLASPIVAGGLVDEATAPDPCPDAPLVQPSDMTDAMFAQWSAIRAMTCGMTVVEPRSFFDRATGERLTDEEITRRIFNGSTPIAPVPLPAGGVLLFGALAMLWRRR